MCGSLERLLIIKGNTHYLIIAQATEEVNKLNFINKEYRQSLDEEKEAGAWRQRIGIDNQPPPKRGGRMGKGVGD